MRKLRKFANSFTRNSTNRQFRTKVNQQLLRWVKLLLWVSQVFCSVFVTFIFFKTGFSHINSLFTYNVLMHYFAPSLNVDPERYPLNSLSDRIRLKIFSFILGTLCRYTIVIWALTKVVNWNMEIRLLFANFYERYFEKKYVNIRFPVDKRCPFNIKLNYSAKI